MTNALDPSTFQLGKAPAKIDPRSLRLGDFIDWTQVYQYPATFKDSDKIANWQMLGNDVHGDCVYAGVAHWQMLISLLAGTPWEPNAEAIVADYLRLSPNDGGLVILDFLKYLRKTSGAISKSLLGFASVDWRNPAELAFATSYLHGVLRGILLPKTAQSQSFPNGLWQTISKSGDGTPGSWGGHLTYETDYDADNHGDITWSYVQKATRDFMLTYCDECWVLIPNYSIPGFKYNDWVTAVKEIDPNANFDPIQPNPTPPLPAPTSIPYYVSGIRHDKMSDGNIWISTFNYDAPPSAGLYAPR